MVTHFDDRSNDIRSRSPRAFYDFMEYFKRYNENDAMFRLFCVSNKLIKDIHLVECINTNRKSYLGISREKLVKFHLGSLKPQALIDPHMIDELHYVATKSLD